MFLGHETKAIALRPGNCPNRSTNHWSGNFSKQQNFECFMPGSEVVVLPLLDGGIALLNWQAFLRYFQAKGTSRYMLRMLKRLVVKGLILMIALIAKNI
jgi:hypothetical protein